MGFILELACKENLISHKIEQGPLTLFTLRATLKETKQNKKKLKSG